MSCNGTTATSNAATLTVVNPQLTAAASPLSVCPGTAATLTGTGSAGTTVKFFDTATSPLPLATGGSFTTPALTAPRQYFVAATLAQTGTVGPPDTSLGNTFAQNATYGLTFNVLYPITLTGVNVFPATAGTLTVEYQTSAGLVLQSAGFTVTAAQVGVKTFVPLGFTLNVGTGFRLMLNGTSSTATLVRNTTGANYPYASTNGVVSLTGSTIAPGATTNTHYAYFYDWLLTNECSSARTAVQVNLLPASPATITYGSASYCLSATNQPVPTIAGTLGGSFGSSGAGLPVNASTGALNLGAALPGTYTISYLAPAGGGTCGGSSSTSITVTAPQVATFNYLIVGGCPGSTNVIAPVFATGATAGTFTATPAGLTLNAATGVFSTATSAVGTYVVTNTLAASAGCAGATATQTVTIFAPPVVTLSASAPAICGTSLVTLTVAGGSANTTYQFYLNGGLVPGSVGNVLSTNLGGTYTAVATNAAGCSATTAPLVLLQSALPAAPTLSGSAGAICGGAPVVLTAGAASGSLTYQFLLNGTAIAGATGTTYTATAPGTYTLTATNLGGCSATSAALVLGTSTAPAAPVLTSSSTVICGSGLVALSTPVVAGQSPISSCSTAAPSPGPRATCMPLLMPAPTRW